MEPKDTDNPMAEDDAAGSEAPSSSNGRIPVIKIKIPKKVEDEEAAAAAAVEKEEVKSHCCKECNKSFSSGKALGGHMSSAHVQANKDYSFKKLSSKRKSPGSASGSNSGSEGTTIPCTLCHKSFSSKKSLFGHMRCHPERYWRGMVPPPEAHTADVSSEDGGDGDGDGDGDDGEHDQIDSGLGFNLKGWALSNKRGRGPVINPAFRAPDEEKENESFVAGLQLIKMLKDECSAPRKPEPEFKNNSQEGKGKEKGKEKVAENQDSESPTSGPRIDPNDELYNTAIQVLVSVKLDTQKRAAAAASASETDTTAASPEKYKCNVCGRLFPTHQALGGHRSSHNKFRMTIINTNSRSPPIAKKRNYNSNKKNKSNDVADADTDTATAASSSSAFAFAFDLNMAPAPEEEMEDVGGGSSNHSSPSDS